MDLDRCPLSLAAQIPHDFGASAGVVRHAQALGQRPELLGGRPDHVKLGDIGGGCQGHHGHGQGGPNIPGDSERRQKHHGGEQAENSAQEPSARERAGASGADYRQEAPEQGDRGPREQHDEGEEILLEGSSRGGMTGRNHVGRSGEGCSVRADTGRLPGAGCALVHGDIITLRRAEAVEQ